MYYDYKTGKTIQEKESLGLKILYDTIIGRLLLKITSSKKLTRIYAKYMNSKLSKHKIKKFIKKNHINMDDYVKKEYTSFNDFFIRKIKNDRRAIGDELIAVCDSKLSAYKIDDKLSFNIKNSKYTVEELIREPNHKFSYALVFRLCVDDYHHYVFADEGRVISKKYIDGILHTVRPIAFKKNKVFLENCREVTFLDCKNLGKVCYVEVGATMVGKIVNRDIKEFKKGEEKGHFEFGGSTVIMLIEKNVKIDNKILSNTKKEIETIVKLGDNIGRW